MNRRNLFKMLFGGAVADPVVAAIPEAEVHYVIPDYYRAHFEELSHRIKNRA